MCRENEIESKKPKSKPKATTMHVITPYIHDEAIEKTVVEQIVKRWSVFDCTNITREQENSIKSSHHHHHHQRGAAVRRVN